VKKIPSLIFLKFISHYSYAKGQTMCKIFQSVLLSNTSNLKFGNPTPQNKKNKNTAILSLANRKDQTYVLKAQTRSKTLYKTD